jgi:hypothetical protein
LRKENHGSASGRKVLNHTAKVLAYANLLLTLQLTTPHHSSMLKYKQERAHIHTHTHTRTHTYVHTHTHVHTNTNTYTSHTFHHDIFATAVSGFVGPSRSRDISATRDTCTTFTSSTRATSLQRLGGRWRTGQNRIGAWH